MNPFIAGLGEEFTGRWWSLLTLPGALFVAVAGATVFLGTVDPADQTRLGAAAARTTALLTTHDDVLTTTVFLATALLLLLVSYAVGLAARTLGGVVRAMWFARPLFGWAVAWNTGLRHERWRKYERRARTSDPGTRRAALHRLYRIAPAPPSRPTWMADQVAGVERRLRTTYGLDLVSTWPRLAPLLPETLRTGLDGARAALDRACVLGGWALLYLAAAAAAFSLSWPWWPLCAVALVTWVVAWVRARTAVHALATLMETSYDLHARDLAEALGFAMASPASVPALAPEPAPSRPVRWVRRRASVPTPPPVQPGARVLTRRIGVLITHHLRKDPPRRAP